MKKLQTWLFNCLRIFNSNSRLNSGSSVAVLNTSSLLLLYENMKVRFYGQVISLKTNNFKKSSPKSYINSDMEPNSIRFFLFNFFLNCKNLEKFASSPKVVRIIVCLLSGRFQLNLTILTD